jgi:hypothetical protein
VFGTMGLLALGLSYILLPMFVLAPVPDERRQIASGLAALAAVALACAAAAGVAPTVWRALALAAGSGALALHLALMRRTLAAGMRRDLARAGVLMRIGWGSLAVALALAAAGLVVPEGEWADRIGRLFVVAAVAGWLLSFLLGVLQRIVPFLAAMHAAQGQKRPPTPSMLTVEAPLAWHLRAHVAALALLVAGTAAASPGLTALAAVVGAAGAGCFAVFVAVALARLRRHARAARRPQA